jgi:hypothetical protein
MSLTPPDVWQAINSGGVVGVVVLAIVLIVRGTLVTKGQHDELRKAYEAQVEDMARQIAEWKELALMSSQALPRAVDLAAQRVRNVRATTRRSG